MNAAAFVHLHVHTEYSLVDSTVRIPALMEKAAGDGMPAIAMTDRNNLFGLVKFYRRAIAAGVKPIVGADLQIANEDDPGRPFTLIVLCQDNRGYRNLSRIISRAYVEGRVRGEPMIRRDWLDRESCEGLIALSGGPRGDVGHSLLVGHFDEARERLADWRDIFGDRYYLELVRTGRSDEEGCVEASLLLASEEAVPVVASNDVRFIEHEDFYAHEARVCIHESRGLADPDRPRHYSNQQYLRSSAEMIELFSDVPEALENALEIARRCNLDLKLGESVLPAFPVPEGQSEEQFLEAEARRGLDEALEEIFATRQTPKKERDAFKAPYLARLDTELRVIRSMGFPGYFLIVADFIRWARDNDIPVGPGRGSGAGSLVAWVLGITDLDPLEHDLLFERFLNPERVSMPDFDIDFCMEGRDRVISHVSERYGQDAVSQIITFGTMAAKAVVRDVARVQGKPYGLADKLSKLIPFEVGMTLEKAVSQSSELADFIASSEEVGEIMDMAYKLEGVVRGVGRHAGGVVIAPSALTDFVPLYMDDQSGGLVSQFDKDDVESAGLVKFDFLGLKTLTIIDWAVQAVNAGGRDAAEPVDIDHIPLDDPATFEFLRTAETTGVFQLESSGMKDLIRRLKPDSIDDIIALVALFRPGPLQSGAVDDYINRKHGQEPIVYPHPGMEGVLQNTYGVMLYQEQVMQTAQVLAGFSLGEADLLRRAMGKKKPEEMAKVREQFLSGCSDRGVDGALADQIFDLMEKFSGYAFNKSHSATYALVSFQTAWLKTHHPAEFMAATLSADMQNTDKVVTLVDEVRGMGLPLIHPSVNRSQYRFSATDGAVVYGLGAVRGVGEGPVQALMEARAADGEFASLPDFCRRVDSRKANRRVLEALIRAGAMDDFAEPGEALDCVRARLMAELGDALQGAEQAARDVALGMSDMFGGLEEPAHGNGGRRAAPVLGKRERLEWEKEALGLYLSGHPIEDYLGEIREFCGRPIADLEAGKRTQVVAGLVFSARSMRGRRGEMGFVVLDDRSKRIEVSLFSEVYLAGKEKVVKDAVLVVEGEVQPDDYTGELKMRADNVYNIEEARRRFARELVIDCCDRSPAPDFSSRLKTCLEPFRDGVKGCSIAVVYKSAGGSGPGAKGRIVLGRDWAVSPCDDLLLGLRAEFGDDRVAFRYAES